MDDNGQRVRVQPVGEITDLQEMRDLVINAKGLRLGDIADVRLKPARMNYGRRLDGNPAVGLDIFKERSANLVEVSHQGDRQPGQGGDVIAAGAGRGRRRRPDPVDHGAVLLPAPLAFDPDGDAGDPDLLHHHPGLHVLRRGDAEHPDHDGPAAGGGHAGRQRRGGGGEHLPGTRAHARAAAAGFDHRHPQRGHRAQRGHVVPLHRVRAEPVRRDQQHQHLHVADRDHHLGLAAGFVAGRGQPDPDAVRAHGHAQAGALADRHDRPAAAPLCHAAGLVAAPSWLEPARHRAGRAGQPGADEADQDRHVRR
ncbi:hypothetical protein G6F31_014179 [Rhizopus arrhizus]|nr:hypothetical protein G6F31_014179 [Rhizopus arrhizus]